MNKYARRMEELQAYYVGEGEPRRLGAEEIRNVEGRLGCALPEDYAAFLADYGCYGFDSYVAFPIRGDFHGGNKGLLNVFFGVAPGSPYDLFYNRETFAGRIPANLLPIADDPGANIICLSVGGADRGRVYFWEREGEEAHAPGAEPGRSNLYLIENLFDEFINALDFWEDA